MTVHFIGAVQRAHLGDGDAVLGCGAAHGRDDVRHRTARAATEARRDHGLSILHCNTASAGRKQVRVPSGAAAESEMRQSSPPRRR